MSFLKNIAINLKNNHVINRIYKKCFHRSSSLLDQGNNVKECLFCPVQQEPDKRTRKISIIGASGHTGSTMAFTLMCANYCDEIVMVDTPAAKKQLVGHALDCIHSGGLYRNPKIVTCTNYEKTKDSDVLVFCAGIGLSKGKTRLDILQDNVNIYAKIVPPITKLSPNSVILLICNPSDLMAYTVWRYSNFDRNRIISTGTELDSTRFRYNISQRLGINPYCVHGWIVGEHGNSSVALWSSVNVAGTRLREIDPDIATKKDKNNWNEVHQQVIKDGIDIHFTKGWTDFGVTRTANNILMSVLGNSRIIHSVSTQLTGLYGIETDIFISFPCVIGNKGVSDIVQLCLTDEEMELLNKSACLLQESVAKVKFP